MGNYITVGALESADTECVLITAVSGTDLTIQGFGNNETTNVGFKFAHASGVSVVESQHVGTLTLLGRESLGKAYSDITGPAGLTGVEVLKSTNIPNRFTNFWWHLIAGYGRLGERKLIRAEFPAAAGQMLYTEVLP